MKHELTACRAPDCVDKLFEATAWLFVSIVSDPVLCNVGLDKKNLKMSFNLSKAGK